MRWWAEGARTRIFLEIISLTPALSRPVFATLRRGKRERVMVLSLSQWERVGVRAKSEVSAIRTKLLRTAIESLHVVRDIRMNDSTPNGVPVLAMHGVWKSFGTPRGPVHVLRGLDLEIAPGSFVVITGPSGSGKSTFLNLASLLDTPTKGTIQFAGRLVSTLDERELCALRKERLGMVFQKFCLLTHRSAIDNVAFRFRYLATPASDVRAAAETALGRVGLAGQADQPVRLMSGGEMQRVAIARAVAQRPDLLVADEPTGNLDRASADSVMEVFQRLHTDGITILLVTHNEHLLRFATRHLVCREGRLEDVA